MPRAEFYFESTSPYSTERKCFGLSTHPDRLCSEFSAAMTPPNLSAQNRTRLFYLVRDLLDKSHSDGFVRDESPSGLAVLDELLRRRLGRLQLVPGKNLPDSIAEFVQTASETELLDLIESVPRARLKTGGALRGAPREDAEKTMSRLDRFMEFVGVSARFRSTGTLNRDAFETPEKKSLSKLQKKEELSQDLKSLLSRTEPTAVILFDLDGFKAVNERNGYEAGDKCLQATVDAVVKCILHKGKIYRFRERGRVRNRSPKYNSVRSCSHRRTNKKSHRGPQPWRRTEGDRQFGSRVVFSGRSQFRENIIIGSRGRTSRFEAH